MHQNESVALGVHGENGDVNLPVEDNIRFEIVKGFRVGADSNCVLESLQVGVQIQAGLLIEGGDFSAIDGASQKRTVVDAGVRGRVAAGT